MSEPQTNVSPGMVGARRYPRTFGGLVAAMLVLVVGVVAYWGVETFFHSETPSNIVAVQDWKSTVVAVQQAGKTISYPAAIPAGWTVTSTAWDVTSGGTDGLHPRWKFGMTDGTAFAGLYEQDARADDLITLALGDGARADSALCPVRTRACTRWVNGRGEVARQLSSPPHTVLIAYATSQDTLNTFIGTLTTARLKG